jgi:hypothetical protein
MQAETAMRDLHRYGRARLHLGRVPIWIDSPHEETSVWISVMLPEVTNWVEGRRGSVVRMLHSSPELREHLLLSGQQAVLRAMVPKKGLAWPTLQRSIERLLAVATRWHRWLSRAESEAHPSF